MEEVTKGKALAIATEHASRVEPHIFNITDSLPSNCAAYGVPKDCWYIFCSAAPTFCCLISSRLICVSKMTGKIVYDGSANDEG